MICSVHKNLFIKRSNTKLNCNNKSGRFFFKSLLTWIFSCLSSSSSGERTSSATLFIVLSSTWKVKNRKLSTYSLSLQLNSCLWYAKYRTCHRNEKKIVYMWIRIESLSKFIEQFTDKSTKICMLNL